MDVSLDASSKKVKRSISANALTPAFDKECRYDHLRASATFLPNSLNILFKKKYIKIFFFISLLLSIL